MPTSGARRRAGRPALVLLQLLVFLTYIFGPTASLADEPTPDPSATESTAPEATSEPTVAPEPSLAPEPTAAPSVAPEPTLAPEPTAAPATPAPSSGPSEAVAAPTITSDKADYAPGELVTLTGSNWQLGETVRIRVEDNQRSTWTRETWVTADSLGNIVDSFTL